MKIKLMTLIIIFVFLNCICVSTVPSLKKHIETPKNHLLLGSYAYVKKIQHIANSSGARSSLFEIMSDVNKYGKDLDNNTSDNILRFYKLVNSTIAKIGYVDIQTHYFRNQLNRVPKSLNDLKCINKTLPLNKRWLLLPIKTSVFHMQGKDGEYNLKFVSCDGSCEAVYNKYGILLNEKNDPINMGTYNYAAGLSIKNAHRTFDILPYLEWGNTSNSPQKGMLSIRKGVNITRMTYKKHATTVYLYRKNLFGIQYGSVQ